jgi:hypothetical protein
MRYRSAALALLVAVAPAQLAAAQSYGIQGVESYLRVEWEAGTARRGPAITGYVHNVSGYTADRVRLVVESLDGAGQVRSSAIGEVLGTVPPYGRSYFEIPVRETGPYRVRVLSFDPIGRGA